MQLYIYIYIYMYTHIHTDRYIMSRLSEKGLPSNARSPFIVGGTLNSFIIQQRSL